MNGQTMAHIKIDEFGEPYAVVAWSVEDIFQHATEDGVRVTREQAIEVINRIVRGHDACIGINWEVISTIINIVVSEHPLVAME